MTTNGKPNPAATEAKKFLLDPYREWAAGEGIPIHLDFGHDLIALETGRLGPLRRPRLLCLHPRRRRLHEQLRDRGPAGAQDAPAAASLRGVLLCPRRPRLDHRVAAERRDPQLRMGPEGACSRSRSTASIRSSTIRASSRCGCRAPHDAPITINLYHNLDFVFDNPFSFPDRAGLSKHFEGEGDHRTYDVIAQDRDQERLGDELRPRPHQLQALRAGSARQGIDERELHPGRRDDARPCVANPDRPLQEGASSCRRHACARGRRRGLFAAVVRRRFRVQGISLEARLHVHAAVLDVPSALQHLRPAGPLSRLQPRQPALSVHLAAAQELRRRRLGLGAAGRPPDRVRGSGSAHPPQVARGDRRRPAWNPRWAISSTSPRFSRCRRKR